MSSATDLPEQLVVYVGGRTGTVGMAAWTSERRSRFLLREDVRFPLSLDRAVTPETDIAERIDTFGMAAVLPGTSVNRPHMGLWMANAVGLPQRLDAEWAPTGYDICDQTCVSALMNCGYRDASDKQPFVLRWARFINDYHLFDDISVAEDFCRESDARVPEHAPFSVIRIYLRQ